MEKNIIDKHIDLLVIGGSAGSLEVMLNIIPYLKEDLEFAIVVVLHRRNTNDASLLKLFAHKSKVPVREAEDKEYIQPGIIYLAPADYHLLVEKNRSFSLDDSEKINHSRPSIDVTFESAADVFGASLVCMLLSGANADGTNGLIEVKNKGGFTVVQDPLSAAVAFMPQQAIDHAPVDLILHKDSMVELINKLGT